MTEAVPIKGVSAIHGGVSLVNLTWNHHGSELVVFDSLGKISVLTTTLNPCEFSVPKKCVIDAEDNLNEVVGHLWLNTDKLVIHQYRVEYYENMLMIIAIFSSSCPEDRKPVEFLASAAQSFRALQPSGWYVGPSHSNQGSCNSYLIPGSRPDVAPVES